MGLAALDTTLHVFKNCPEPGVGIISGEDRRDFMRGPLRFRIGQNRLDGPSNGVGRGLLGSDQEAGASVDDRFHVEVLVHVFCQPDHGRADRQGLMRGRAPAVADHQARSTRRFSTWQIGGDPDVFGNRTLQISTGGRGEHGDRPVGKGLEDVREQIRPAGATEGRVDDRPILERVAPPIRRLGLGRPADRAEVVMRGG